MAKMYGTPSSNPIYLCQQYLDIALILSFEVLREVH